MPLFSREVQGGGSQSTSISALTGSAWVPDELRDVADGNFQKAVDPQIMVNDVVRVLDAA
jgi:hypothetical protein